MIQTHIYCVFPDRATALELARFLTSNPELEDFAKDGWWRNPDTEEDIYWCIDVVFGTGEVYRPVGEPDSEGNYEAEQVPGFHINGLWGDNESSLPEQITPFRVFPSTPICVFG